MKALKVGIVFLAVFLLAGSASADDYDSCLSIPLVEAETAMLGDSEVAVTTVVTTWTSAQPNNPQFYYEFQPVGMSPDTGFIFYPGGTVSAAAYAPMALEIARAGFFVALVPMPDCLAIHGMGRADTVIDNNPGISTWAIGGHSFGGVAAGWYLNDGSDLYTHETKIDALVLWASYPSAAMAYTPERALSLWGTNDALITEQTIIDTAVYLPAGASIIELEGANHTQFGWYGRASNVDYDYLTVGTSATDIPADISRQEQQDLIVSYTVDFLDSLNVPTALASFDGLDDSVWESVNAPGFGSTNNFSVVAMAEYQGRLYATTRNQSEGAEVWRTNGTGWEQVLFPGGETNGIYGNPWINNVWARMIVFNSKLYVGFSSGLQGNYLGSTGCEIWRFDGTTWEPVISDKRAVEDSGALTSITDAAADDGNPYGYFYDTGKAWTVDQWVGGVLTITSGTGQYRKFRITANTETRLTVQQNETAGTYTDGVNEGEFTVSAEKTYVNMFPRYDYTLGAVNVGDSYEINTGYEQNGFGDIWNKTITAMVVFNDTLYVSTGLNYENGAQVWYTADGDTWDVTQSSITATEPYTSHSFGNFHSSQSGYPGSLKPISSSITDLAVSSVAGTPVLYAGGTGTTGSSGGCARLAQLTGSGWEMIVDNNVDANTDGSNENGFGSPSTCGTNQFNFMPWGLTDFMGDLMVAISGQGTRVLRAAALADPETESMLDDDIWTYSVGSGNVADDYTDPMGSSIYPNGFDGYTYSNGTYQNIATNLYPFGDSLFGGTISFYVPEWDIPADINEMLGAQLWTSLDGVAWTQVTDDGFGDSDTIMFEAFAEFNGTLYVSGSKGASSTPSGLGGATVYRMAAECTENSDCEDGYECVSGMCEIIDDAPALGDGPFLTAGSWPVLPTDPESAFYLDQNYDVLWTFSDDYASCPEELCTHTAQYQAVGDSGWINLPVSTDGSGTWYAFAELPIESLANATTYALRFTVEDCAEQSTESEEYYFRVARYDDPPVIGDGPFVAGGTWPVLATVESKAFVLDQDSNVLWTFSDDYATCSGLCTHRARYRLYDEAWTWLEVTTDPSGEWYAYTTLPVDSLAPGTYRFHFDVSDCDGQRTYADQLYYFTVE